MAGRPYEKCPLKTSAFSATGCVWQRIRSGVRSPQPEGQDPVVHLKGTTGTDGSCLSPRTS